MTNPIFNQPVEPKNEQELVLMKFNNTVTSTLKDVINALAQFPQMEKTKFRDTFIINQHANLTTLKGQSKELLHAIVKNVDINLQVFAKEHQVNIESTFAFMAKQNGEPEIKQQLLEAIAYPHVKKLMKDLGIKEE